MTRAFAGLAALPMLLLAACTTTVPLPSPPLALATATPQAMVAAIRAAAAPDDREVAVQPLRDPRVEDLRQQASRLEAMQRYSDAAGELDKALAIVPDDPALLQERAEAALLQHDDARAEQLARQAYALGAKVGPLCRRHWATVQQVRLLAGDAVGATAAQARIDACKVAGPNRF